MRFFWISSWSKGNYINASTQSCGIFSIFGGWWRFQNMVFIFTRTLCLGFHNFMIQFDDYFFQIRGSSINDPKHQKTGPNSSVVCRACILDAPKFSKQFRHYALFFWVERFITSIDTNLSVVTLKMLRNIGVSTADSSGLERVRETLDFMRGFSSTKSLRASDLTGMDWSVGPLGGSHGYITLLSARLTASTWPSYNSVYSVGAFLYGQSRLGTVQTGMLWRGCARGELSNVEMLFVSASCKSIRNCKHVPVIYKYNFAGRFFHLAPPRKGVVLASLTPSWSGELWRRCPTICYKCSRILIAKESTSFCFPATSAPLMSWRFITTIYRHKIHLSVVTLKMLRNIGEMLPIIGITIRILTQNSFPLPG